ncbi:MAG: AtpZ/AtpI family protein, partial [Cyanobacteria bacterium J06626_23]
MAPPRPNKRPVFLRQIEEKARRKVRARRSRKQVWYALGLFGMVGWAVTLPTLMGIALGVWIDRKVESQYSWTLMLLVAGVGLGCWNAWYWVTKESRKER